MCNALLGMVQAQALLADGTSGISVERRAAAWREQLRAVGVADDERPEVLIGFLHWQALRLGTPLREIASREQTGPLPLAASHAVDALQTLLELIGTGQSLASAGVDELPATLRAACASLTNALANVNVLLDQVRSVEQEHSPFTREELQDVEQQLLDAAVDLAPPDQPLPDSATATFVLCGALAPLADGLQRGASAGELHGDVARLGAAAASFLIALTDTGPSSAQLDSASRHVIVAVPHGDRGISRIPFADIEGDRWFLQAVAAVGELMAKAASGPPVTEKAYTSLVTGRTLEVLRLCGAWLAHTARRQDA